MDTYLTRRPVALVYGEKTIIARYRPNDILITDYDGADDDPHGTARRLIVSCLAAWTLKDMQGHAYPVTPESVARLPDRLVLALAAAIAADMRAFVIAKQQEVA